MAGLALWSCAQAFWAFNGVALDHAYPFPSASDIGFVGYALPVAVGLVLLPPKGDGPPRMSLWRAVLDVGTVASAVLFIAWGTVLGPLITAGNTDTLAFLTTLAYPFVDVVMVSLVIVLTMRAARGRRLPWLCLGLGFLVLALTDSRM